MATKKLVRRRVLIREYDYERKLKPKAKWLYSNITFEPINQATLEQEYMWATLQDKHPPRTLSIPALLSWVNNSGTGIVYSLKYHNYDYAWDSNGDAVIWYAVNKPRSRLGWAILEYQG
jgi:hypothetical protein